MAEFVFTTDDGIPAKGSEAIFPILKVEAGQWAAIGTGFFISTNGVFLTAWHVLKEALNDEGTMNCDGIAAFQFLPDNHYLIRPVLRSCHHRKSDIAIGVLAPARDQTGAHLANKIMSLTTRPQPVGEEIVTWAFPQTKIEQHKEKQAIRFQSNFYSGAIEEHFPVERDSYIMPFPSYRGNMPVLGGASGGPAVGLSSGRVFGVNCTGIEGLESPVSHYASLSVIRDLWIEDVTTGDVKHERLMVGELIDMGHITCD